MEDLASELLQKIRQIFKDGTNESQRIAALRELIQGGGATYIDAEQYAYEVGNALANALGEQLSSAVLPDGRMEQSLAESILRPLLQEDYDMVSAAAVQVQTSLNSAAGIGIKAQTAPLNVSRIEGIIGRVSAAEQFDAIAWILAAPVVNFSQAVVDDTLKANVDFQGEAGLRPKIVRKATRKCCKWCSKLEGEYAYPDVPKDVYRRHANCRCEVDYDPGGGMRQNVWTKRWATPEEVKAREARKLFSEQNEFAKYTSVRYNKDGTVVVTDDWKQKGKISIPSHYAANAVIETQTAYRDGSIQINRTFYDSDGWMKSQ
ncbi:MAG: hypothetical protein RR951_08895, partial [Ruthenibacterium sp.]